MIIVTPVLPYETTSSGDRNTASTAVPYTLAI